MNKNLDKKSSMDSQLGGKGGIHRLKIIVAGASGFIGRALGKSLAETFHLIGLSRAAIAPGGGYTEYRCADLFSLRNSEEALAGADVAIYLVHSMMPAARLVQGHFRDLDILCADNFARAAASNGVKHIIYVGGLLPDAVELSEHLESRLEVEKTLGATGIPVTTIRAGMVVGAGGSSYQLLARLVRRLPIMACPKWTRTRMQPIALDDLIGAIECVLQTKPTESRVYDVGCPQTVTYQELMAATAKSLNLSRTFVAVPFLSPRLSQLWLTLVTRAPKALVGPLIQSLEHEMVARTDPRYRFDNRAAITVDEMLDKAADPDAATSRIPRAFRQTTNIDSESKVFSVQRMALPAGKNATWAATAYFRWLPHALKSFIRIEEHNGSKELSFVFRLTGQKLLGLERLDDRSDDKRQVLRVTPGLLARASNRGRLEFRQVLDGNSIIASIQDFVPRLPWWVYRATQGLFHRWVMYRFSRHLQAHRE